MRRRPAIVLGSLLGLLAAAAPPLVVAQPEALARLAWLAGCWSAVGAEPGSVEHWLPPAGGTMFGVSRTVKGGRTVAHEFLQIRADAGGSVEYVASPSGQRTTAFALARLDANEAAFENPAHDFPQRIVYTRLDAGRLVARIEGTRGGQARVIRFPMTRVACDAEPPAR